MNKPGWGGKRADAGRKQIASSPTRAVSFTLPQDLIDRLKRAARKRGSSRSQLVAEALEHFFKED